MKPKFILSKNKVIKQYKKLKNLGLKISYSYKTNKEVGDILQKESNCEFSIHRKEEINMISQKNKIWFFTQANSKKELSEILQKGIKKFVIDHEQDLENLLSVTKKENKKISLSIRMKFSEHRIGSGRYFVYGLPSKKVNKIISNLKNNPNIDSLGVHIHRKSQNTSEWQIVNELKDSLTKETLETISTLNLGGGLPVKYKTYSAEVMPYILKRLKQTKEFLDKHNIKTYIEPGRFIAAPPIKLQTEIIQIYEKNIILNCSIYNGALDTAITNIKMSVKEELSEKDEGDFYLLKGNTPTRDDIFRYKVKLNNPKPGDKITFLNAGAYNWTTDFCGFKKLKTEIIS